MKAKSSLWNQIIPYFVAAVAIAYLIYVLVVQGDSLQYIHFWIFLLIVGLILAPLAERLKIGNLIDFNSKLQSLRNETKKELEQIRNQVSSVVQTSIVPMQHQWTVLGVDEQLAKKLAESVTEQFKSVTFPGVLENMKAEDSPRTQFLRQADISLSRAYDILSIAHLFQIAINEGRMPKSKEIGSGTVNDRIGYLLEYILKDGVESFVPPKALAKTTKELRSIERLLKLYHNVDSEQAGIPSEKESTQLFENIKSGLDGIWAGIVLYGSQAIVAHQNIMRVLKKWKGQAEDSSDGPENKD